MSGDPGMKDHKALSVPEILGGFRDLGGPRPPEGAVFLSCDPAFNRYTRFWVKGPTLDATHGALETLLLLSRAAFEEILDEDRLFGVLREHFVAETGMFSTDGIGVSAGLYGLQNAVGLLKTIFRRRTDQKLGEEAYASALRRIGQRPELALKRMEDFLRQCAVSARGGLLDHPGIVPHIPTVTTLHTATSTLWNLYEDHFGEVLDRTVGLDRIEAFIAGCLRQRKISGIAVAAFSIHPEVDELCANTTFFALETLRHLHRESLLVPEVRSKIASFLTRAIWSEQGGGSSTVGEMPSLNATLFSLRALSRLMSEGEFRIFVGDNLSRICAFVESCGQQGGYAFTNRPERYLPNPLATRYALQIRSFLRKRGFNIPGSNRESVRQIVRFLQDELMDEQSRAYRGYPPRRIEGETSFSNKALYLWRPESKDSREQKPDELFALLADGLQKAWAAESLGIRSGEPKKVRVRGGRIILRREARPAAPSSRSRYHLRKDSDGIFKLVEASPARRKGTRAVR